MFSSITLLSLKLKQTIVFRQLNLCEAIMNLEQEGLGINMGLVLWSM